MNNKERERERERQLCLRPDWRPSLSGRSSVSMETFRLSAGTTRRTQTPRGGERRRDGHRHHIHHIHTVTTSHPHRHHVTTSPHPPHHIHTFIHTVTTEVRISTGDSEWIDQKASLTNQKAI